MDREDVQPIVEIVTKLAIGDHLFQIAVGGGDQANVGLDQLIAAQTFKLLLLQNAQQLRLKFQRHVANFVEEQRTFVRQFETPNPLRAGPGKRAALMAKQIAFQQSGRHCRAVHFHHSAGVASAQVVNCPRDQLLTRSGFTQNQDGAVALRHHFDLFEYAVHRFAAANDFAELTLHVVELFRQRQVFVDQTFLQAVDLLVGEGVIYGDRHAFGDLTQQF